eukprot:1157421-Pelagomonas_calceolata.AAC.3
MVAQGWSWLLLVSGKGRWLAPTAYHNKGLVPKACTFWYLAKVGEWEGEAVGTELIGDGRKNDCSEPATMLSQGYGSIYKICTCCLKVTIQDEGEHVPNLCVCMCLCVRARVCVQ